MWQLTGRMKNYFIIGMKYDGKWDLLAKVTDNDICMVLYYIDTILHLFLFEGQFYAR